MPIVVTLVWNVPFGTYSRQYENPGDD